MWCGVGCVCVCVCLCPWVVWCGCCHRFGVACLLLSGGLSSMRCLLYLNNSEQTWRHHLATFKRVMVTPVVCPGLFEFLITLTFEAQRGIHFV